MLTLEEAVKSIKIELRTIEENNYFDGCYVGLEQERIDKSVDRIKELLNCISPCLPCPICQAREQAKEEICNRLAQGERGE